MATNDPSLAVGFDLGTQPVRSVQLVQGVMNSSLGIDWRLGWPWGVRGTDMNSILLWCSLLALLL